LFHSCRYELPLFGIEAGHYLGNPGFNKKLHDPCKMDPYSDSFTGEAALGYLS